MSYQDLECSDYSESNFGVFLPEEDENQQFQATQIFCNQDFQQEQFKSPKKLEEIEQDKDSGIINKSNKKSQKTLGAQKQLECNFKQAQFQISQMKKENCSMNQLKCELLKNETERQNYQDNIDKIEYMLSTLKEENNYLKNQNQQIMQLNQKLNQEQDEIKAKKLNLEEENKNLILQNEQFSVQIEENLEKNKQEKLQELKQLINVQHQIKKELKSEKTQNQQLQNENQQLQDQIVQIDKTLNQQKEIFKNQQNNIQQLKNEFQNTQQEKSKLQQLLKSKEVEMKNITEKVNQLCHQQQKLNELNEVNQIKNSQYENFLKKLSQIYNLNIDDQQNFDKLIAKVQSIEDTNKQIKQRIKILAEVISKQDNNYKVQIQKVQQELEEKKNYIKDLEEEKNYKNQILEEFQVQYDELNNDFNECCIALKQINKQYDQCKQQFQMAEQEKEEYEKEKIANSFFISNLSQHIFQQDSLQLIQEVQGTYQKILDLQAYIDNLDISNQNKDFIKSYENEILSYQKKLQNQLDQLRDLRNIDYERYKSSFSNQKQCISISNEIEGLKQKKPLSLHANESFGQNLQKQCSNSSNAYYNGQNRENKFNNSNKVRTDSSLSKKQKKATQSQSLLGQFLSIRSNNNSALSYQM